jgi:hypothetical protein
MPQSQESDGVIIDSTPPVLKKVYIYTVGDLSRFWLSCLGPLVLLLPKLKLSNIIVDHRYSNITLTLRIKLMTLTLIEILNVEAIFLQTRLRIIKFPILAILFRPFGFIAPKT